MCREEGEERWAVGVERSDSATKETRHGDLTFERLIVALANDQNGILFVETMNKTAKGEKDGKTSLRDQREQQTGREEARQ